MPGEPRAAARWRWWLVGAGLLLVAVGIRWRAGGEAGAGAPGVAWVAATAASPASAVASAPADDSASPAANARVSAEAVADSPVDPACPAAWRALAGRSPDAIDRTFRRLQPVALAHAAQALAASPEAFERVVGRLLADRARDTGSPPSAEAYLALVSEALASADGRLAALAIQLCAATTAGQAPACGSISAQRWAALDGDNLQAWLAVASEAQERGDHRAVRDAMARAARVPSSRLIWSDLLRLANSPALAGLPPTERQVLIGDLIGLAGMFSTNGMTALAQGCSRENAAAPARRDECGAIAGVLVDQGQTLIERGLGIAIGRRAGWSADRVEALESEHQAMLEAVGAATNFMPEDSAAMTLAQACQIFRKADAVLSMVSSGNEVDLARRALQQSRAASAPGPASASGADPPG